MDNDIKTGAEENPLAALLSNKELLSRLSGVVETLKTENQTPPQAEPAESPAEVAASTHPEDALSSVLSNPELMAKLPDIMAALTPVLKGQSAKKAPCDKRTALLLALRPYLSAGRCEAIDYITRIGKLGDVIKTIK